MQAARHPAEAERLAALARYGILDSEPEGLYDDVVALAAKLCNAPIAIINLVAEGRQWFKAEVGLGVRETPLDVSICAHAILQPGLFEVPDTLADPRFANNPLVVGQPHLRFYAGALLETEDGFPLGTLCTLDYRPRRLTEDQKQILRVLARQVMTQMELRRSLATERAARSAISRALEQQGLLLAEMDHRVKNSLAMVSGFLAVQAQLAPDAASSASLEKARDRVQAIATVHDLLQHSPDFAQIEISPFLQQLCGELARNAPASVAAILVEAESVPLSSRVATAIGVVVNELVTNAGKYAYAAAAPGPIRVDFACDGDRWRLAVSDDGRGLPADFTPEASNGLGLRVVLAEAQSLGGTLRAEPVALGTCLALCFPPER